MPLPLQADYGLLHFLAYVFYPPLYLAGPIMTYQDFAWQLRQPVKLGRSHVSRSRCVPAEFDVLVPHMKQAGMLPWLIFVAIPQQMSQRSS